MADARKELKDAMLAKRGYILPLGRTESGDLRFATPGLAKDIFAAFTLPGDVYAGRVDPMSDEAIGRSFDLAGAVTLGAGAVPMKAGESVLRMGFKAPGTRADLAEALRAGRLTRDDPGDGPPLSAAIGWAGGKKAKHYAAAVKDKGGIDLSPEDAARLKADALEIEKLRDARARNLLTARDSLNRPHYPPADRLKRKKETDARNAEYAAREARIDARVSKIQELADQGIWRKDFAERAITDARIGSTGEATKATLEAIPRLLAKEGWTVRHASKGGSGRKSSRYVVSPDGKFEVRLSDHYLPDTPQREYSRQFSGPRWHDEVVIDDGADPREVLDAIRASYREFISGE